MTRLFWIQLPFSYKGNNGRAVWVMVGKEKSMNTVWSLMDWSLIPQGFCSILRLCQEADLKNSNKSALTNYQCQCNATETASGKMSQRLTQWNSILQGYAAAFQICVEGWNAFIIHQQLSGIALLHSQQKLPNPMFTTIILQVLN